MSFFSQFPNLLYDLKNNNRFINAKNIFRHVDVNDVLAEDITTYTYYEVQEGETPEIVSDKHHGSPYYHWVILMTNDITHPYHDWPKSTRQLQMYLNAKYGENVNSIKYYYVFQTSGDTEKRIEVPSTTAGAISVSNYEYEVDLNEEKRSIDLLRNEYLSAFLEEFDRLIV